MDDRAGGSGNSHDRRGERARPQRHRLAGAREMRRFLLARPQHDRLCRRPARSGGRRAVLRAATSAAHRHQRQARRARWQDCHHGHGAGDRDTQPLRGHARIGRMTGKIYIGTGGWTFEPWRGVFYPKDLTQKRELEYASRKLSSIEINGTYYSSFKPASWAKWRDETPDGFVFAMKASRFCTNRRVLADAKESIERYVSQGLVELKDRLGPINWQFMATKKFDPEDIESFLKLLPKEVGKLPLRHALEVRHDSFKDKRFYDLCRKYNAAIVYA